MRGSRKFCQRGSNSNNDFLLDERREDPNTTIADHRRPADDGPSLNASFGSFVIFQGIRAGISKKPYRFVIFSGGGGGAGGGPDPVPPLDPPMVDIWSIRKI